jgi:hypothetical protein
VLDTTWQSIIGVIGGPHSSSDSTSHELWIGTAPQMIVLPVSRFIMWFIVTSCGSSGKSPLTILRGRISKPRQESAPHKVTMNP